MVMHPTLQAALAVCEKPESWHADRAKGIGGSEAAKIMSGDGDALHQLWLVKTGRAEPDDLSGKFNVQLGSYTEAFILAWLAKTEGWDITPMFTESQVAAGFPFIRCNPDAIGEIRSNALYEGRRCVIDAKHTGPHSNWWGEEHLTQRYYWQLVHNSFVADVDIGVLAVAWGNEWRYPMIFEIPADHQMQLAEAETKFWRCVEEDREPASVGFAAATATVKLTGKEEAAKGKAAATRVVDMQMSNAWPEQAAAWVDNKAAAAAFKAAEKGLKDLVEDDVKHAYGHGVQVKRDAKGSLRITAHAESRTAAAAE